MREHKLKMTKRETIVAQSAREHSSNLLKVVYTVAIK